MAQAASCSPRWYSTFAMPAYAIPAAGKAGLPGGAVISSAIW